MSKLSESVGNFVLRHSALHKCALFAENCIKKPVFGCQDCGQCVLGYDGFTCPMRCPKQIRNGPCGSTRADGHCEVYPERYCVWWLIYQRSKKLGMTGKLRKYHVPVDRRLEHTSAWMNMFAGKILPISLCKDLKKGEDDEIEKKK
ncbi:methylenetetrahydrofolate reductase C-terminal domain-containing protein [bacterium]|nr:methylenetetrahydrofolate reductase C-terminal domain-containing protein [bacterium]